MTKFDFAFISKIFLFWVVGLFLLLLFYINSIAYQDNFLGGGIINYLKNPYFWAFGNFDGEHYVSIAQNGYQNLTYFFFPLYPIIIGFLGKIFGGALFSINLAGILTSLVSFFIALVGLYKLIRLDYGKKIANLSIVSIILFPTSFFFASVYTESLFLALAVWTFYFARKGNWVLASFLGILISATRIIGIVLLPALFVEYLIQKNKGSEYRLTPFTIFLIPTGLVAYMYYVYKRTGDFLEFVNNVSIFGDQRSSTIILLPQVFYRYLFKILPNLHTNYFPILFSTYFEFLTAVGGVVAIVYSFRKLRLSYWVYLVLGYLIPTFSGSFSSLPRYVLVLFPIYIVLATVMGKNKYLLFAFIIISTILLIVSFGLFSRGYWIS